MKTLYVIEKSPDTLPDDHILNKIRNHQLLDEPVTIFIQNDGIRWLLNENWEKLFDPEEHTVYYANAKDVKSYSVPFQEGVIYSNPKILNELINWAEQVFFITK